jgi:hypothetical protein
VKRHRAGEKKRNQDVMVFSCNAGCLLGRSVGRSHGVAVKSSTVKAGGGGGGV